MAGLPGLGCVSQSFDCGTFGMPGNCAIGVDLAFVDTTPDAPHKHGLEAGAAYRALIYVDDVLVRTIPPPDCCFPRVEFEVACGPHVIAICLEVDADGSDKALVIDNVTAACEPPTPIRSTSWSGVKNRFNRQPVSRSEGDVPRLPGSRACPR